MSVMANVLSMQGFTDEIDRACGARGVSITCDVIALATAAG
jgi:hypothetical protein